MSEEKKYTGELLIQMGYKPSKWFGECLQYLNCHEVLHTDLRTVIEGFIPKYNTVVPHNEPLPYDRFLEAETDDELINVMKVEETMDIVMKTPTVYKGAIMPDACPSGGKGNIPVGGLVITDNAIHPSYHSADICCSVMITGFGTNQPKRILDLIHNITDFGGGPRRKARFELPASLDAKIKGNRFFSDKAKALAWSQLGTQGDGNHFAFVGTSKNTGETCLVTHHGSRGIGAELYKAGMACADKWRKRLCPSLQSNNAWIPYDSEDGVEYWEALQIVREWTKLNHEVLHFGVREKVKYHSDLHFWNEHNFVFKKDNLFYHAKGSTPMLDMIPDNKTGLRLIPLNMAEPVLIVSNNNKNELGFAPHGAGRNLSRSEFNRRFTGSMEEETKGLDVRFFFDNPDFSEFPSAYKNAEDVKRQIQKFDLANIEDEILPYGCIMAGNSTRRF